jgi:hypothetical protein
MELKDNKLNLMLKIYIIVFRENLLSVFNRSDTVIVNSDLSRGMDECLSVLLCLCCPVWDVLYYSSGLILDENKPESLIRLRKKKKKEGKNPILMCVAQLAFESRSFETRLSHISRNAVRT